MDKLNFIKISNFCISKNTTKKVKRQPTKWEKAFANHLIRCVYTHTHTHTHIYDVCPESPTIVNIRRMMYVPSM